jgi:hypothetical protein
LRYDPRVTLFEELMGLVDELSGGGVDYALVGGLAVAVWGAPRATRDIDLLVQPAALEPALAAAARRGFDVRALPMTFRDGMQLQRVTRADGGALLSVDFILVNPNLEATWSSRRAHETSGRTLWVVSRDALIAMKALAARPQDIADIENLRDLDR